MSPFSIQVLRLIKSIPPGKVASYGQIALLAGNPQGSRGVGWILNSCSESHHLPWQRVLSSQGRISFPRNSKEYKQQKKLLVQEGIEFKENDSIDLEIFGWKKKPSLPKNKKSTQQPRMFSK